MSTEVPDSSDSPETDAAPEAPPPPDPHVELGARVARGEVSLEELGGLDRLALLTVVKVAGEEARDAPGPEAIVGLQTLRRACLLANERELLGLVLRALADVALVARDQAVTIEALEKLAGLMELTKRPERAHGAFLELAQAQELAERAAEAELTLMHAVTVARAMATGVGTAEQQHASSLVAKTLRQLGTLLINQGRTAEGREWLDGAEAFE